MTPCIDQRPARTAGLNSLVYIFVNLDVEKSLNLCYSYTDIGNSSFALETPTSFILIRRFGNQRDVTYKKEVPVVYQMKSNLKTL